MNKTDFYHTILTNTYEGIYFVDADRQITFWNGGAERITGFLATDVIGKRCMDNVLNHMDEAGNILCLNGCPLHSTILDGEIRETSVYLHHKDGHRVPVTVKAIPIIDNDRIEGAVEIFIDDSEKHEVLRDVEEYKILAMMDQLTELPNRRYIDSFLSSKFKEYKELGIAFGVLFMDLDKFKMFNDTYGHDIGDEVLKMVGRTFLVAGRATDLIGRYGGEEFVAVLAGIDESSLAKKAERLRMLVENGTVEADGQDLKITISVGASMIKEDDTVEALLRRADGLLYTSKELGRNRVTIG